jgi:predicted transcriptional regulator
MRSVLWYVFIGSRGGDTRMRIVDSIMRKTKNANELTAELKLDYSTIRHSLRVLEKNRIVFMASQGYAARYQLTPEFESMAAEYAILQQKLGKST